jgi:hypothetical protein
LTAPGRSTDQLSDFDMRQMILLEEGLTRHQAALGRTDALRQAAAEMPLVFDLPTLDADVRAGSPMLPSTLAMILGWVSQRSDWQDRRTAFTGPARDTHTAEARQRSAGSPGGQQ